MEKIKKLPKEPAVQLITHLSEGAYTTFSKAIKELIINSFDARANKVELIFNEDYSKLIIKDDGKGLSSDQFESEMARIAGSKKRIEKIDKKHKRPIIGRFGIGFLSVARLCETAIVRSKEKENNFEIVREIPLKHLFLKDTQLKDLNKEYYYFELPNNQINNQASYTIIELNDVKIDIRKDLLSTSRKDKDWDVLDDLSGFDKFKWELGLLLPIQYRTDYPIFNKTNKIISKIKKYLRGFNFKVFVNSEEIFKPVCLGKKFYENSKWSYGELPIVPPNLNEIISINENGIIGYIYNQSTQITPSALKGILLHINFVGIKGYNKSLFDYPKNLGPRLFQMSGELYLSSYYEELLSLDKDDFKEDHPKFKELVNIIHEKIKSASKISYERSKKERSKQKKSKKEDAGEYKERNVSIKTEYEQIFKEVAYFKSKPIEKKLHSKIKEIEKGFTNLGKNLSDDNDQESRYISEAIFCFEKGCFKAAVVMIWVACICRIQKHISNNFDDFKLSSTKMKTDKFPKPWFSDKYTNINSLKQFNEGISDYQLLGYIFYRNLISDTEFYDMIHNYKVRNNCAHPSTAKMKGSKALAIIDDIYNYIFCNSKIII